MKSNLFGILLLALLLSGPVHAEDADVFRAAKQFFPTVEWRADSVLAADFTCQGRKQHAILGLTKSDVLVAVFAVDVAHKPLVIRFDFSNRTTASIKLEIESLDFKPGDFDESLGQVPEGMKSSKTCSGLNLGDGETDSAHIYWNHKRKVFSAWSL